jgi:DNA-binding NtrC family response regulator
MSNAMQKSILLVDANPCVLALVKALLEGQGYRVLLASNTECALRIVSQKRLHIDYLMTNTSDRNAPDLAARVLEVRPGIEMLFMSSAKDPNALRLRMLDDGSGAQHRAQSAIYSRKVAVMGRS